MKESKSGDGGQAPPRSQKSHDASVRQEATKEEGEKKKKEKKTPAGEKILLRLWDEVKDT